MRAAPGLAQKMRRIAKTLLYGVFAAAALLSTLMMALLVVAIFWPLPLSILQSLASSILSRAVAPLQIAAEDISLTWDPVGGAVTFIATDVQIQDREGNLLGELPSGEVDLALVRLIAGEAMVTALRLDKATLALVDDSAQGLRLSVGPNGSVTSPALLRGPALDQVIGQLWDCSRQALPSVQFTDSAFFFRDQAAAVYLAFALNDMRLEPRPLGGQIALASHLLVAGQRLSFDLAAEQDCATSSLALTLFPKDIHPAVLGEVIPGGRLLYPFEVPVSGRLEMRFGPDRGLKDLDFNLTGGAGSLEVASYAARNLAVESLQLIGSYSSEKRELTLKRGRFDLEEGSMLLEGRVFREAEGVHLTLRAVFRGGELLRLLPRWFAGLRTALRKTLKAEYEAGDVSLSLDGVIDDSERIDARGSFVVPFADHGRSAGPNEKLRLDFRLDGQVSAPRLVVSGQTP